MYKQSAKCVYLGTTVYEIADLTVEINWRVLLVSPRFRRYGLLLYNKPTVPLRLKLRMFEAEVTEPMIYGRVTWSPIVAHLAILRALLTTDYSSVASMKNKSRDGYHMLSYAGALAKTGCEYVETTVRKRRMLFEGFVTRMGDETLPKRGVFVELDGFFEHDFSLFNSPTDIGAKQWTLAAKASSK